MSEEKNVLDEVIAAIKELLGFGETEQIATMVNGITEANGDENGIVAALKGFFGDAIGEADLLSVVQGFLGQGKGLDLSNITGLFQGIGEAVGGFDKIAGLMGMAANAGKVTDAVGSVTGAVAGAAGSVTGAVADAAGSVTGAVSEAAGSVTGAVAEKAGSVTGAVSEAAGSVTGAVAEKAGSVTGAVLGDDEPVTDVVEAAFEGMEQVAAESAVKAKAKAKKKWPVVLGVVAAVLLLAGIGMFVWHEQPSFCGAICHDTMDAYLEGYNQEDNAVGVDKYGNDVANTHSMLAVSHKSQNVACLGCHVPSVSQQIGEGMMTISGSYTVVDRVNGNGFAQHERTLSDLLVNAGHADDTGKGDQFCLRSGCHDMDRAELAKVQVVEGTVRQPHLWLNTPHASAGGMEFACGDCHKSHRASVNACTACHADAVSPEGWLTFAESNAVMKAVK